MKWLCWIGLHKWRGWEEWTPSIDAPIVTRYQAGRKCVRCNKVDAVDWRFDPTTGRQVDGDAFGQAMATVMRKR
jgi:hypothetical protein